ncbi:General stress protein 39 [Rubripirellula lacrimiformis]|uniref:General stress protein 39 n=1 Tax=Rubripirellula lacrimiformis TaxID=1930273 RepID=A0A517N7H3_9BACT|nr:SDR family NAD(P)-dependent oxidoreductase [Rubripirellula lacrimiformis]QDT03085.1 General stress protein 39 [Rubripirellula lacrimiformis]
MSRRAIVAGGSTGIGRGTAIALAKSGHDVTITFAHKAAEAQKNAEAAEATGQRCIIEQLDLSSPETAKACVDKMVEQLGRLDALVSSAGMMVPSFDAPPDFADHLRGSKSKA